MMKEIKTSALILELKPESELVLVLEDAEAILCDTFSIPRDFHNSPGQLIGDDLNNSLGAMLVPASGQLLNFTFHSSSEYAMR